MLHVFYLDVAKVDLDVTHVAMAIYVRCNCMFQMFYLFFRHMLQVLFRCYICLTYMLQEFYLNVAYFLQWLFMCF
jgi:hypothetical protein